MKIKEYKNGAYVTFESNQGHDVPYIVKMKKLKSIKKEYPRAYVSGSNCVTRNWIM